MKKVLAKKNLTQNASNKKDKYADKSSEEIFNMKTTSENYSEIFYAYVRAWEREHGEKITGFGFRSLDFNFYMQHQNDFTTEEEREKNRKKTDDFVNKGREK